MAATSPRQIAAKGQKIYEEKYRAAYEKRYMGKFVAIEIENGEAFVAPTAEEAIEAAEKAREGALFHLIKIGSTAAFHISSLSD